MADVRVSLLYVDIHGKVYEELLLVKNSVTVEQVITQSQFLLLYPEYSLETMVVGIYGLRKSLSDSVFEGDRVEVYRPLLIDPKDRRRLNVDGKRDPKKWRQLLKGQKRL